MFHPFPAMVVQQVESAKSHIPKPYPKPTQPANSELEPALPALQVIWMHSWSCKLLGYIVIWIVQNRKVLFFFFAKINPMGILMYDKCADH